MPHVVEQPPIIPIVEGELADEVPTFTSLLPVAPDFNPDLKWALNPFAPVPPSRRVSTASPSKEQT